MSAYKKIVAMLLCAVFVSPLLQAQTAFAANTLSISLDPTLVTGPIPAGAPTYIFAAFKLTAGTTAVTINSLKVVSDSAARNEFRNIGIYKDGSQFIGAIVPTLTNGSATYTFSPAITIAAGNTVLLETSASLTNQANGNMRLGLDGFQFGGTAPTVTPSLPIYGNNVPVSGGGTTETITATVTPAACGTTNATVSITVQGTSGTVYSVKKGTAIIATIVGSGTTSDTVAVGASNTYTLFSGATQVGTSQTVTGTQQNNCGNPNAATLTAVTTPANCTALSATITLTIQGTTGITYTVMRNGSVYATLVGNGSISDTVAIGTTNSYTLFSGTTQIGSAQTVTGVRQTGCTPTGTLTATTTPASCTATNAGVTITLQGTTGITYTVMRNGSVYATLVGNGSISDTVAIGTTNSYTLFSGTTQIGSAQTVTGVRQTGCTPTGTLTATTTPASCTATNAGVTITLQGTTGITYTVMRNGSVYATLVGNGSISDTVAIGTTNSYTLFSGTTQIGSAQTVTGVRQTGCTPNPLQVTINKEATVANAISVSAGQKNVLLFDIKVASTGGDVTLLNLTIGGATTTDLDKLENKRLAYDAVTLSGVNGTTGSGTATYTFASPIVITNGSNKIFRFFADITSNAAGTSSPKITSYSMKDSTGQQFTAATLSGTLGTTVNVTSANTNPLTITTNEVLPEGIVGQQYTATISAAGGTAPYVFTIQSGLSNTYPCCYTNLSANGTFSSVDNSTNYMPFSGTYQLPVKVTDAAGASALRTFQFTIKPAGRPAITVNEGYLDTVSTNNVSGWAYKTKSDGSLTQVSIIFENTTSGLTFTLNVVPSVIRNDVASYLQKKYNVSIGSTPTGYTGVPASVITTNGTYRIRTATYDGTPLILSDAAKQTFVVGSVGAGPTGKYVKVDGDPTVYWITLWGGKMPILNAQVFQSYNGRWENIVLITQETLDTYDDVEYIKLQSNARIYKISNGLKQYLTPAAAARLNVDPNKVVAVNSTEFYSYKTGKSIQ